MSVFGAILAAALGFCLGVAALIEAGVSGDDRLARIDAAACWWRGVALMLGALACAYLAARLAGG
mgnify:CR=1 FL=1